MKDDNEGDGLSEMLCYIGDVGSLQANASGKISSAWIEIVQSQMQAMAAILDKYRLGTAPCTSG